MARVTKLIARTALWHALKKRGEKLTERAKPTDQPAELDRDLLVDGCAIGVEVMIAGKVGPVVIDEPVRGSLTVGHAGATSRYKDAPVPHLVAYLLARHGEEDAAAAIATLEQHYRETGALPEVSTASLEAAASLLGKLRTKYSLPTRGPVKLALAAA